MIYKNQESSLYISLWSSISDLANELLKCFSVVEASQALLILSFVPVCSQLFGNENSQKFISIILHSRNNLIDLYIYQITKKVFFSNWPLWADTELEPLEMPVVRYSRVEEALIVHVVPLGAVVQLSLISKHLQCIHLRSQKMWKYTPSPCTQWTARIASVELDRFWGQYHTWNSLTCC